MEKRKVIIPGEQKVSLGKAEADILPIDGLPPSIRRYILAVEKVYHCPREFITCAVLVTAATAVGRKMCVDEGRYQNHLILWFVFVAKSGSNKSFALRFVTKPLRLLDKERYEIYKREYKIWKETDPRERGEEPKCRSLIIDDCTDERRNYNLYLNSAEDENGNPGQDGLIGIYSEFKGMFDSKSLYNGNSSVADSRNLNLYDQNPIKVDRKSGFTMYIEKPIFNILGDIQNEMLVPTFGKPDYMVNGLPQRFLFCIPDKIEFPERSLETVEDEILDEWKQTVYDLYYGECVDSYGRVVKLFRTPGGIVKLTQGADFLYHVKYNEWQHIKDDDATPGYIASLYGKMQIQVLRLAGTIHALKVAEEKGEKMDYNVIDESTMEYALRCMEYFERQGKKLYYILSAPLTPLRAANRNEMTNAELLQALVMKYPGVSKSKLAEALNVSPAYISKVLKESNG